MTISQRAPVDGVICDVVCTGRFYDFFEKRDGRWGFVLRRLIYEKDRLDPVDPAAKLALDADLLAKFPEGYRHLAYLQSKIGYKVKRTCPGSKVPISTRFTRKARAGSRARPSKLKCSTRSAAVAEILAAGAVVTFIGARLIERAHPPRGRFVDVGGLRQHVVEIGDALPRRRSFSFTAPAAISKTCGLRSASGSPRGIASS